MGGRSSNRRPGGTTRRGPANEKGLARSDHWGSVRKLTPSSCTRTVEWPTHVTVGVPAFSRRAVPSFASTGKASDAEKVDLKRRGMTNVHRVQKPGRAYAGFRLRNPPSR